MRVGHCCAPPMEGNDLNHCFTLMFADGHAGYVRQNAYCGSLSRTLPNRSQEQAIPREHRVSCVIDVYSCVDGSNVR